MFDSVKIALLTLLFGVGASLTPAPQTVGPGEVDIHAAKPMEPVFDSMQVYLGLGAASKEKRMAVLTGKLSMETVGDITIDICAVNGNCCPLIYKGPFFSNDRYGLLFAITDERIKGVSFASVKVYAAKPIYGASIDWQNYLK